MSSMLRTPFRFLLGGTIGAGLGAAYTAYSSLTWVVREVKDLEVRVSEAEGRIERLEERVDSNELKSSIRMDVMEQKMEEYRAQLLAEMEMMKREIRGGRKQELAVPLHEQVRREGKRPLTPPPEPRE